MSDTIKKRNIPSPGHCTGKRAGELLIANRAVIYMQKKENLPLHPIMTDEQFNRIQLEVSQNEALLDDYASYMYLDEWIERKRPLVEALFQQAQSCIAALESTLQRMMMAEALSPSLKDLPDAVRDYSTLYDDLDPKYVCTLEDVVSASLLENYRRSDPESTASRERLRGIRNTLLDSYFGLIGFDCFLQITGKAYQIPELSYYKTNADYIFRRCGYLDVLLVSAKRLCIILDNMTEDSWRHDLLDRMLPYLCIYKIEFPESRKRTLRAAVKKPRAFSTDSDFISTLVFSPPPSYQNDGGDT